MGYHTGCERNELLIHTITSINLKIILLSVTSQMKKKEFCFICEILRNANDSSYKELTSKGGEGGERNKKEGVQRSMWWLGDDIYNVGCGKYFMVHVWKLTKLYILNMYVQSLVFQFFFSKAVFKEKLIVHFWNLIRQQFITLKMSKQNENLIFILFSYRNYKKVTT